MITSDLQFLPLHFPYLHCLRRAGMGNGRVKGDEGLEEAYGCDGGGGPGGAQGETENLVFLTTFWVQNSVP